MKTIICLFALIIASGCATPETTAYRIIGTTSTLVDGAMNGWGDWVRVGKATPEAQAKVRAAYTKYQASMRVAKTAIFSYKANPTDASGLDKALKVLDDSRNVLLDLITTLTKK